MLKFYKVKYGSDLQRFNEEFDFKQALFEEACKSFGLRQEFNDWARRLWGTFTIMGYDMGYQVDYLEEHDMDKYYTELDNYIRQWANVKFYELTNGSNSVKIRSVKINSHKFIVKKEV